MNHCTVRARDQAKAAARQLDADPRTLAVDVIDPATDPTDRWTVDVILVEECDAIPTPVLSILSEYQLAIHDQQRRGDHQQFLAVA